MTLKQEYTSFEDLRVHGVASNEKTLVSEIPNKLIKKLFFLHRGKETNSFNLIEDGGRQKGPLPVFPQ